MTVIPISFNIIHKRSGSFPGLFTTADESGHSRHSWLYLSDNIIYFIQTQLKQLACNYLHHQQTYILPKRCLLTYLLTSVLAYMNETCSIPCVVKSIFLPLYVSLHFYLETWKVALKWHRLLSKLTAEFRRNDVCACVLFDLWPSGNNLLRAIWIENIVFMSLGQRSTDERLLDETRVADETIYVDCSQSSQRLPESTMTLSFDSNQWRHLANITVYGPKKITENWVTRLQRALQGTCRTFVLFSLALICLNYSHQQSSNHTNNITVTYCQ